MQPLVLPLKSDETIRINGYRDGRGIRVCFQEGGFVNIGLFRHAYRASASDEETSNDRVTVRVHIDENDALTMEVRIKCADRTIDRFLPALVCDEINERLLLADALLTTAYGVRSRKTANRTAATQLP